MAKERKEKIETRKRRKPKKFNTKMQANILLVFCIIILLFSILIGRIWFLKEEEGERYKKRVLSQQTYVSNEIPYQRGSIVDRKDTVFAKSVKIYNLVIDCKQLLSKETYKDPTINALTSTFPITKEELITLLKDKPDTPYNVMLKGLNYEEKDVFEQLKKEDSNIKGVWFEEEYKREYPLKTVACDVIGFTASKGSEGIVGLESYYNEELTGTAGREYGYFDADLKLERIVKPSVNGNTIVTTLDANIQEIVEKHIEKFNKETGSKNTAILVMNPNNGEIYAMASEKPFDLNNPWDLSGFYSQKEIKKMTEEEKSDALNAIWRNFCINDAYEPGSTFKPITIASALEENIVNDNISFSCDGGESVGGRWIRCAALYGHGPITLRQTLMKSCNDAMMQMGKKLGRKVFHQYQVNFGFGSETGIDLPGEAEGMIFTEKRLNSQELATSSFGQNFTCTMLQLACANASLINGGYYYQPRVVKQIINENGATVKNMDPVLVGQTVSAKTSQLIRSYLRDTVEEDSGTAKLARVEGYEIGGKTGTAEKFPRGNKKYLVSFLGFTPIEKPEVLVYVIVDEPGVKEQAHSTFAQAVCSGLMKEILPFFNIHSSLEEEKGTDKKDKNKTENGQTEHNLENIDSTPDPNAKPQSTGAPTENGETKPTENPEDFVSFFDETVNQDSDLNSNLLNQKNDTTQDKKETQENTTMPQ